MASRELSIRPLCALKLSMVLATRFIRLILLKSNNCSRSLFPKLLCGRYREPIVQLISKDLRPTMVELEL